MRYGTVGMSVLNFIPSIKLFEIVPNFFLHFSGANSDVVDVISFCQYLTHFIPNLSTDENV